MTVKNLGKVLNQIFIFILSMPVFALSTATVNQDSFYPNDVINFTIIVNGNNVIFPPIKQIAKHAILSTSSSQSINIINGKQNKKISKSYSFRPSKSLIIPAFEIEVDGKIETTQPIQINLLKPSQSKAGDDFILEMKAEKNEFFMGDEVRLMLILKQKKSIAANDNINITPLKNDNLLLSTDQKFVRSQDANYNIYTLNYQVQAKNFGLITIAPVVAAIGNRNNNLFNGFFNVSQNNNQRKIYSNAVQLNVKPLPDDLTIYGDFKINIDVDKTAFKQGEALNAIVQIYGNGNFEDIEEFSLDIPNATIYSDEPTINNNHWEQKFAIVAQGDFAIPSFYLDYFDKLTQNKKRINTQNIDIRVEANKSVRIADQNKKKPTKISFVEPTHTDDFSYYYLLLGVAIGAVLNHLTSLFRRKIKMPKNQDLLKQIKTCKNDKALFDLLLPLNLPSIDTILKKLEANLYKGEQHKINKKDIISAIQINEKTSK